MLVDSSTLGDRDLDGRDDVSVSVFFLQLDATSEAFGDLTLELIDPSLHPEVDQTIRGVLEESANTTPGTLDLPPYTASGTGNMTMNVLVQTMVDIPLVLGRAHNDFPLILSGDVTSASPPPDEVLAMQNTN